MNLLIAFMGIGMKPGSAPSAFRHSSPASMSFGRYSNHIIPSLQRTARACRLPEHAREMRGVEVAFAAEGEELGHDPVPECGHTEPGAEDPGVDERVRALGPPVVIGRVELAAVEPVGEQFHAAFVGEVEDQGAGVREVGAEGFEVGGEGVVDVGGEGRRDLVDAVSDAELEGGDAGEGAGCGQNC